MLKREDKQPIFSKVVKAGKRVYFIDIYRTRQQDYYITLKEQFRSSHHQENAFAKKQKIFLYKEDINKFFNALSEARDYLMQELLPEYDFNEFS